MTEIACITNPRFDTDTADGKLSNAAIANLVIPGLAERIWQFHRSIPHFAASPLVRLNDLSQKLGVDQIWVKDESQRFELKAFKMLGASYAIAHYLSQAIGLSTEAVDFTAIRARHSEIQSVTFATATDGNHGRAVAWCAHQFGCQSQIFMPAGSSQNRLDAIRQFATHAEITDLNYDDTVALVSERAKKNNWVLIQDTAWPGYETIPANIMRGYFTLMVEFEKQAGGDWPTHIFLQARRRFVGRRLSGVPGGPPQPNPPNYPGGARQSALLLSVDAG